MTRVSGDKERIKAWSSSNFVCLCLDLGLGTLQLESFHSLCTASILSPFKTAQETGGSVFDNLTIARSDWTQGNIQISMIRHLRV